MSGTHAATWQQKLAADLSTKIILFLVLPSKEGHLFLPLGCMVIGLNII
jgi:hypothetical protein